MKTAKLISAIFIIGLGSLVIQASNPGKSNKTVTSKEYTYLVQIPHTPAQCMNLQDEMKGKGEAYLSKYRFGCMSGDHTAYAFLTGTSEEAVRSSLPKDFQSGAKIEKVDKLTAQQIGSMHKSAK